MRFLNRMLNSVTLLEWCKLRIIIFLVVICGFVSFGSHSPLRFRLVNIECSFFTIGPSSKSNLRFSRRFFVLPSGLLKERSQFFECLLAVVHHVLFWCGYKEQDRTNTFFHSHKHNLFLVHLFEIFLRLLWDLIDVQVFLIQQVFLLKWEGSL